VATHSTAAAPHLTGSLHHAAARAQHRNSVCPARKVAARLPSSSCELAARVNGSEGASLPASGDHVTATAARGARCGSNGSGRRASGGVTSGPPRWAVHRRGGVAPPLVRRRGGAAAVTPGVRRGAVVVRVARGSGWPRGSRRSFASMRVTAPVTVRGGALCGCSPQGTLVGGQRPARWSARHERHG
jgi:hypothetical protein